MTDTNYLLQYFLDHSPKDSEPKPEPAAAAQKGEKKKAEVEGS